MLTILTRHASLVAVAVALCSVSSAQLTLTGAFTRNEQTNIGSYTGLPVGSGTFVDGAAELWLEGEYSFYPEMGSEEHSFLTSRYYSVQVGGDDVSITNFDFLWKGYAGYEFSSAVGWVDLWGSWQIFEVDDANNDGQFTWGESTTPVTAQTRRLLAHLTGQQMFRDYNVQGSDPGSYMLDANSVYTIVGGLDTLSTVSVELRFEGFFHQFALPYGQGEFFNFDYAAVPEPASLSVFGLGAVALLRRRRKNTL